MQLFGLRQIGDHSICISDFFQDLVDIEFFGELAVRFLDNSLSLHKCAPSNTTKIKAGHQQNAHKSVADHLEGRDVDPGELALDYISLSLGIVTAFESLTGTSEFPLVLFAHVEGLGDAEGLELCGEKGTSHDEEGT